MSEGVMKVVEQIRSDVEFVKENKCIGADGITTKRAEWYADRLEQAYMDELTDMLEGCKDCYYFTAVRKERDELRAFADRIRSAAESGDDIEVFGVTYTCEKNGDTWESIITDAINTHGNGFNPCWTECMQTLIDRCRKLAEGVRP